MYKFYNQYEFFAAFDFNALDFAVRDGVPYAIELLNPVPRIDKNFMHQNDYEWILNQSASMLINMAKSSEDFKHLPFRQVKEEKPRKSKSKGKVISTE